MHGGRERGSFEDMQPVVHNDDACGVPDRRKDSPEKDLNDNPVIEEPVENRGSVVIETNKDDEDDRILSSRSVKGDDCDIEVDDNGNITQKKKKPDAKTDCKKQVLNSSRLRSKREPLPMKLRALPQSFWQQPNNVPNQDSLGTLCPALPIACKEEEIECLRTESTSPNEENMSPKQMITRANTDLLFSLFRVVEDEQRKTRGQPKVNTAKRGRPKKSASSRGALKDDDPCLVSTVTEALLPLLPERKTRDTSSVQVQIEQGQQALMMATTSTETPTLPQSNPDHNYSNLLTEVVIRL